MRKTLVGLLLLCAVLLVAINYFKTSTTLFHEILAKRGVEVYEYSQVSYIDQSDGYRWVILDPRCEFTSQNVLLWSTQTAYTSLADFPQLIDGVSKVTRYFQTDSIWLVDSKLYARMIPGAQTMVLFYLMQEHFLPSEICE